MKKIKRILIFSGITLANISAIIFLPYWSTKSKLLLFIDKKIGFAIPNETATVLQQWVYGFITSILYIAIVILMAFTIIAIKSMLKWSWNKAGKLSK